MFIEHDWDGGLREKISNADPVLLPNLANLPRGVYVARIRFGNEQATIKLIKGSR